MSQVDFLNKCVLQSLNIAFIIANSVDPDEMQQTTKQPFLGVSCIQRIFPIIRQVQSSNTPGSETIRPRASIYIYISKNIYIYICILSCQPRVTVMLTSCFVYKAMRDL